VLGTLYLAYDLLGGKHGPLRVLTRAVTYSIVFGIGYAIGLGWFFGLASGIATGITLAIELNRAARGLDHYSLVWEAVFSAIRGAGFGAGLYRLLGLRFAIAFAVLVTAGQILAYWRGMRPSIDYLATRRPRLTRAPILGNGDPHGGIYSHGPYLQRVGSACGPRMVVCSAGWCGEMGLSRPSAKL
jgi:hypothetical protein